MYKWAQNYTYPALLMYIADYYSSCPSSKPLVEHVPVIQQRAAPSSTHYHSEATDPLHLLDKPDRSKQLPGGTTSGNGLYGGAGPSSHSPTQAGMDVALYAHHVNSLVCTNSLEC